MLIGYGSLRPWITTSTVLPATPEAVPIRTNRLSTRTAGVTAVAATVRAETTVGPVTPVSAASATMTAPPPAAAPNTPRVAEADEPPCAL